MSFGSFATLGGWFGSFRDRLVKFGVLISRVRVFEIFVDFTVERVFGHKVKFVAQNVQSVPLKGRLLGFGVVSSMMVRMDFVGRNGLNPVRSVSHMNNWLRMVNKLGEVLLVLGLLLLFHWGYLFHGFWHFWGRFFRRNTFFCLLDSFGLLRSLRKVEGQFLDNLDWCGLRVVHSWEISSVEMLWVLRIFRVGNVIHGHIFDIGLTLRLHGIMMVQI